jgi:hypothetical protein
VLWPDNTKVSLRGETTYSKINDYSDLESGGNGPLKVDIEIGEKRKKLLHVDL